MKKILSLVLILAVILAMVLPLAAMASGTGSSSGSFDASNVAPTVDSITLYTTGGSPASTTVMTPQVEYNVKVAVTDANELSDLTSVKVVIFYKATAPTFPNDVPTAGDTQSTAILTDTVATTASWAIDPSASTSWSIVGASSVQPTLTNTTGTFEFHFIPGKVATAAAGKWYIYAIATDTAVTTGDNHISSLDMNWYGEITNVTSSVSFGATTLGTTDQVSTGAVSAKYISNGNYKEQIKTDDGASGAQWKAGTKVVALLETGAAPGAGQMRLKGSYDSTVGDGFTVKQTAYVDLVATGTQTGESGSTRSTNTLWLSLGSSGIPVGTYSGTVYYNIASR
jgi:hypothetical protein